VENRVYLSHSMQVVGAAWWTATRIMAGVEDLVQRTEDSQAQIGYSVARRSEGQVTSCAVCTIHIKMRSISFLVEPQNLGNRVSWLSRKTKVNGFPVYASKPAALF
jgi:hypothetical protein